MADPTLIQGHDPMLDDTDESDSLIGSTNDLATDEPRSALDRVLQWVPRVLSSKPHVIVLVGLGIYLIVLPIVGVKVSANAELIGGNYTNVTSDIGACIAAGGTLHLVAQSRRRRKIEEERLVLARQTHRLLHHVYDDVAKQLGHIPLAPHGAAGPAAGPGAGPGAAGSSGALGSDAPIPGELDPLEAGLGDSASGDAGPAKYVEPGDQDD
jgi:hypothetical protein